MLLNLMQKPDRIAGRMNMMMWRTFLICIFVTALSLVKCCPHENADLKKFSEVYSGYDKSTDIEITEGILLDVTELDVNTIDVTGNGKLVFNQGHDITVKVKGIAVKDDASLIIGSEICRHPDNVRIVLQGTRTADRSTLTGAGEKYIAVTDRGTLHIYGQDKLAWTKLSQTIPAQAFTDNFVYWHKDTYDVYRNRWANGLSLHIFDSSLTKKFFDAYDLSMTTSAEEMQNANNMLEKLNGVADGDVVAISVKQYMLHQDDTDLSDLFDKIEELAGMETGSLLLRGADVYDAFSLVFVKGGAFSQQLEPSYGYQAPGLATASLAYQGHRIVAESSVYYKKGYMSKIDLQIYTEETAYPEINVVSDISSWKEGDRLLITSTDYAWHHAEVRTIKKITGTNTLQLSDHLRFRHFGEFENGVDMRAEVALLSRNIKIEGEMSRDCPPSNGNCDIMPFDTYGGHIKIIHNFKSVVIDGAELEYMGQRTDMGFYPIHFHMCLDVTGRDAVVRHNSIHHSLSRAVTVHGTYGTSPEQPGVEVIENVAYMITGHAYFLEDGSERATRLIGNLAAGVMTVPDSFTSDNTRASGFWITTPETVVIGNVAAGGPGFGYWYTFPDEPVGPSKGHVYKKYEARHTPMYACDNNAVHSHFRGGLFFDNVLLDNLGRSQGVLRYRPVTDPLDPNSTPVRVQIVRLTAYKNYFINCWVRGGEVEVIQYSSAESKTGLQFGRGAPQPQTLRKSIFMGKSEKNGEDDAYPDVIRIEKVFQFRIGASYYDGPVYFESLWFTNFYHGANMSYGAGAIGYEHMNKFSSSAVSTAKDMRFSFKDPDEGNRVFDGNLDDKNLNYGNEDGDESKIFVDADGSVTGCQGDEGSSAGLAVVKPEKFVLTDNCEYRANWKMAMCNETYGKIQFLSRKSFPGANTLAAAQARRVRYDDVTDTAYEDFHSGTTKTQPEYLTVLGDTRFYYEHQYLHDFPMEVELRGNGVVKDYPVVIGICLPEGTTREEMSISMAEPVSGWHDNNKVIAVNSLEEVKAATKMNKFFIDGRMMYVKLLTNKIRNLDWDKFDNEKCAGYCPFVRFTVSTMRPNTPCFTPTQEELSTDVYLPASVSRKTCQYPATGQPESDWGAGDMMLTSRDGNWGEWSGWADCCYAPGEITTRRRYRLCNNPPKFGDGADCENEGEQFEPCPNACPVDGTLSQWSSWSECACTGRGAGTSGVRSITRDCVGTAHGGKYCNGYLEYISSCDGNCEDN